MSQPQNSFSFEELDREAWIVKRLGEHGVQVFGGTTTREMRAQRIRNAILDSGLDCTLIGRRGESVKAETYAQIFERHFGEPLHAKLKGKSHAQTR